MYVDAAIHWSTKWLGKPYVEGEYDCMDFIQEVLRVDFGREIQVPTRWRGSTVRTMVREVEELGREVAEPRKGNRYEGDGVLLKPVGFRPTGFHIGLYALPNGEPHVLHLVETLGAVIYPCGTMAQHGWWVEGYYQWL